MRGPATSWAKAGSRKSPEPSIEDKERITGVFRPMVRASSTVFSTVFSASSTVFSTVFNDHVKSPDSGKH